MPASLSLGVTALRCVLHTYRLLNSQLPMVVTWYHYWLYFFPCPTSLFPPPASWGHPRSEPHSSSKVQPNITTSIKPALKTSKQLHLSPSSLFSFSVCFCACRFVTCHYILPLPPESFQCIVVPGERRIQVWQGGWETTKGRLMSTEGLLWARPF